MNIKAKTKQLLIKCVTGVVIVLIVAAAVTGQLGAFFTFLMEVIK